MKYMVEVKEVLVKQVMVDAEDAYDAKEQVYDSWSKGEIVLGADDFAYSECEVFAMED